MLTAPFLGSCSIRAAPWGRGSAGRASPLQGEGQEFESPRLHGGVKAPYRRRVSRARRIIGGPPARIPTYGEEASPRTTSFRRTLSAQARARRRAVRGLERGR